MKWDVTKILNEILKNKEKINLFKNRKRLFINIICGQEDLQTILFSATMLFNDGHIKNLQMNPMFNRK